jgi:hypothetical protein
VPLGLEPATGAAHLHREEDEEQERDGEPEDGVSEDHRGVHRDPALDAGVAEAYGARTGLPTADSTTAPNP